MERLSKLFKNKRFRHRFILGLGILVVVCGFGYLINRIVHPVVLKSKEVTVEVGSDYVAMDNVDHVFMGDTNRVTVTNSIDINTVGDYTIIYSYDDKEVEATVHVVDSEAPKLVLKEYTTDTKEKVSAKKFIKSCKDSTDVKTELSIENDEKSAGTYEVTVTATDEAGNSTTETTTLTRKNDKKGPTITGISKLSVLVGDEVDLEDVTVEDNYDSSPDLEIDDSKVDYDKEGTYTVTYTATDRSGNSTKKKRKLEITQYDVEKYDKIVYLTFDDGPSENTKEILDILEKYDINATFFVTGNHDEDDYQYMVDAYEAGNTIGLHSMTHDYSIYASTDTYFDDLNQISDLVKEYTGSTSKIIRFPGGSSNTVSEEYSYGMMDTLATMVEEEGYEYYDWNLDSGDADSDDVDADTIVENATSSDEDYIMILFHDTSSKDTTVEALPKIIKYYKKKGYTFLPITKASYTAHHNEQVVEETEDVVESEDTTDYEYVEEYTE